MATNCSVYKHGILLGTGSLTAGSATLASWSAATGAPAVARKNVQILVTGAGDSQGKTFNTQVLTDNTTTLTLRDACPFVGA